ncbi:hypothetical protein M407DRAFT_9096 [Tulasnella calospora MUT 4182]|uniref:Uncharacterized protein n=1 Tax=Tulasnella calospora MUT 4182 TaxID=1051891 RepID=A0A0C3KRT1_9AGAM|nr:hypothetical protein M407DRAFT_9096 [Tulasnella calospora MUT 4182]
MHHLDNFSMDLANDGLTVPQLLNVLRASPGLQALKLTHMIERDIPQHSPTITLRHLKYIKLQFCNIGLVECILQRIRAPSCTRLSLNIGDERGFNFPHFLNESLQSFHSILRAIHRRRGGSEFVLNSRGFEWHTPDYSKMEGFSIHINNFFDPYFTDWVDRILKDDSGPWINFVYGGTFSETVLRSVAPMRRVTKAIIGDSWRGEDVSAALQFLSKPLTTSTSLPSLPCLQELILPSVGWNTQELLEMVQSRFCALSWETMERTPLTINVQHEGVAWVNMNRRPIPDLVTVIEIRKTSSVKCFKPVGWTDPVGMLAVTWNEKTSQPVWI